MSAVQADALSQFWDSLRLEVQQPDAWQKFYHGWDTTKLLLQQPAETQAEFVLAAVRRILEPDKKLLDSKIMGALGRFISRVMPLAATQLTIPDSIRHSVPLNEMSPELRERHIQLRITWGVGGVLSQLVKHRFPFSDAQIVELLELYAIAPRRPPQPVLNRVLRLAEKISLTPSARLALQSLRKSLHTLRDDNEKREQLQKIAKILEDIPAYDAAKGPWLELVLKDIDSSPDRDLWLSVLAHASACASNPTKRWKEKSVHLIESIGRDRFRDASLRWFASGLTPGEPRRQLKPGESDLFTGYVWMLGSLEYLIVASALANVAEECFKKIPQIGAVSHKTGNACVNALAEMPGLHAVGQLSRLRARLKYNTAKRLVEKALNLAAQRSGITRNDLEDIAVPTFNFELPGTLTLQAGTHTAELAIVSSTAIETTWTSLNGKISKSVPAEVKRTHPDVLKSLKRTIKDVELMLGAQRLRIEKFFLSDHFVPFDDWRKRTVDHPLLAQMTRRLIWQFEDASGKKFLGIWHEEKIVDADGKALVALDATRVSSWHPLGTHVNTVLAWRKWLQAQEITQPFKQAHREIYLLTDAERRTETYSNRFAAHILSQHILNALCRERGWQNHLQGNFDSGGATPTLHLPEHGYIIEFYVEGQPDAPVSGSGIYLYVSTDQVRFSDSHRVPLRLDLIPPRVFSEVMRDVDLFVGVCSIANDPGWQDQGERTPLGAYWRTWAFNELSASALMRREILQELLPKLKIRDRCTIEDKFLIVRGDLAIYKIHLGSGNIMMEPGSQYLCIVPARGTALNAEKIPNRVFLPFEGDNMLAIILSKAFLLAEDTKITDPVITRQLPR